ncbi:MAG: hypothetical protein L3J15_04925 [Devosiaceae bacterium]|nr:hypothetical protein [Devosiaceae bacterium]
MDNEKLTQEISWLKEMAQEGRNSPIVGGIIGIWWGIISFVMMLIHWASITSNIPLAIENIGWAWLAYMIIGSIGTFVLVKKLEDKPGFNSMTSRIIGSTWMLTSAGIFTFTLGSVIATFGFGMPYWIFNIILPVALICWGIANGVAASLSGRKAFGFAAGISFLLALIMFAFLLSPTIYLIAAFAILFISIMSALLQGKSNENAS